MQKISGKKNGFAAACAAGHYGGERRDCFGIQISQCDRESKE